MEKPLAIILMGSSSDKAHAEKIASALQEFGIEYVMRIASAHKTPMYALEILKTYESIARPKVYITIAGRSNALSGFADGFVSAPTITCPPYSENFSGADIYSSMRMPSGISPALVLEPKNAALLAAKIFALYEPGIASAIEKYMKNNADKIIEDDKNICKTFRLG